MLRVGLFVVLMLALVTPGASAQLLSRTSPEDPSPYVDWPALLPPLPSPYKDATERDCIEGDPTCIDRTIDEMYERLNSGIPQCDHRAVFALAYLRVTEDVREAANAGVFEDTRWLQNEDRVFARMYFEAYDAYEAGRLEDVPLAWQQTFSAAKRRAVPALANFLMSMNAHIQRDFPYMLDGIGIRKPDGTSRKRDHDAYNRRLAALYQPVLREVARRFDPSTTDVEKLGMLDNELAFALLQSWREVVWRNAERLTNARTPWARRQVARSIEAYAANTNRLIYDLFKYRDGGEAQRKRDAWCAVHGGQTP